MHTVLERAYHLHYTQITKAFRIGSKLISFHLTWILSNLDLDLQKTLTFKASFSRVQALRIKENMTFYSFDLDQMTLILKPDGQDVSVY